jgi:hypothetical protein
MVKINTETVSALAAIIAAIFAGYSGIVARQTMMMAHHDATESLQQTQRAYVGIVINDKDPHWTADFRATGATPALHTDIDVQWSDIADDEPVEPTLKSSDEIKRAHPALYLTPFINNALLLPGNSSEVPFWKFDKVKVPAGKVRLYYGAIHYTDVFGQQHVTHYCIRERDYCDAGNDAN